MRLSAGHSMKKYSTGRIHSFESFGTVDGPGIRYVVFFQGCPMRCKYCHNPDTWEISGGMEKTVDQVLSGYHRNKSFYQNGGITATGGEPLLQLPFLTELFEKAREEGIHTCLDTSGIMYTPGKKDAFLRLLAVTDLVMLDIKHPEEEGHKELTGQPGHRVWEFFTLLKEEAVPVRLRYVLVPGITDGEETLKLLGQRLRAYPNMKWLEVLPYHTMGCKKYEEMGLLYPLLGVPQAEKEDSKRARELILQTMKAGLSGREGL